MTAFMLPFDLEYWIVNIFAGSPAIFLAVAFLFIASLAATFRMTNSILATFIALFVFMFSYYSGGIVVLVVVLASLIIFYAIARLVK